MFGMLTKVKGLFRFCKQSLRMGGLSRWLSWNERAFLVKKGRKIGGILVLYVI